jgi:predicted dehydrogenase
VRYQLLRAGDLGIPVGEHSIALYYGVHEFDLARWYAGEVERIYPERGEGVLRAHGYELEDLYSAVLRFRSGAHGTAMLGGHCRLGRLATASAG